MSATISEAKRYIKRIILTNIFNDKKGLSITPLISGKHGIGKSQMMHQIADEFGGICKVIEGGTLKEGEITGLPYQYKDDNGNVNFNFLPYYVIRNIQETEKQFSNFKEVSGKEKLQAIKDGKVKLIILFFDEINRTETAVYRELMNILLTRSVNGYEFPWWVQIVGAMNPGSQNSEYAVNEMDPAQLDRFLKIKVDVSPKEWLKYAEKANIFPAIQNYIKNKPNNLSFSDEGLEDKDESVPSPRGWEMVSLLLDSEPELREFFTDEENKPDNIKRDMLNLVSAKLGEKTANDFFAEIGSFEMVISPAEILKDDEKLSKTGDAIKMLSPSRMRDTCNQMIDFITKDTNILLDKSVKIRLNSFIKKLSSTCILYFTERFNSITEDSAKLCGVLDAEILNNLNLDNSLDSEIKSINI